MKTQLALANWGWATASRVQTQGFEQKNSTREMQSLSSVRTLNDKKKLKKKLTRFSWTKKEQKETKRH